LTAVGKIDLIAGSFLVETSLGRQWLGLFHAVCALGVSVAQSSGARFSFPSPMMRLALLSKKMTYPATPQALQMA